MFQKISVSKSVIASNLLESSWTPRIEASTLAFCYSFRDKSLSDVFRETKGSKLRIATKKKRQRFIILNEKTRTGSNK